MKQQNAKSKKEAKNKLPAGTPKQGLAEGDKRTSRDTTDPPVPNRAHTEM